MGERGLHLTFTVLDEWPFGTGASVLIARLNDGAEVVACPACQEGRHEDCWQHAPPQGKPFLTCPCAVVARGDRYVVAPGRCPYLAPLNLAAPPGGRVISVPGFVVFDRQQHVSTDGWFAMEAAAIARAADLNWPSAADLETARTELAAMLDML